MKNINGPFRGVRTAGRTLLVPGSRSSRPGPRPVQVALLLAALLLIPSGAALAVPPGTVIGYDPEADKERFCISERGVVVVTGEDFVREHQPVNVPQNVG